MVLVNSVDRAPQAVSLEFRSGKPIVSEKRDMGAIAYLSPSQSNAFEQYQVVHPGFPMKGQIRDVDHLRQSS
jgi:hypothetical protein